MVKTVKQQKVLINIVIKKSLQHADYKNTLFNNKQNNVHEDNQIRSSSTWQL